MTMYSLKTGLGKSVQAVLELALAAALVAVGDMLFGLIDEPGELLALGVPASFVVGVLFFVRLGANWWKVRRASLAAGKLKS